MLRQKENSFYEIKIHVQNDKIQLGCLYLSFHNVQQMGTNCDIGFITTIYLIFYGLIVLRNREKNPG